MPLEDGTAQDSILGNNNALADETEALNSIYDPDTVLLQTTSATETTAVLRLPDSAISFLISFATSYPDVPPQIIGTQSTGESSRKGEGEVAVSILRDVLGRIYTEGAVCLFDLVEEAGPLLSQHHEDDGHLDVQAEAAKEHAKDRSASPLPSHALENLHIHEQDHAFGYELNHSSDTPSAADIRAPNWTLSDTLTVSKSTFVARACTVHSLEEAQSALAHLLATNKKVAQATHNISAWRMRTSSQVSATAHRGAAAEDWDREVVIQDCDDDGETAAGSRLLHLLQLMDVWNCLVVVSRWYGGVKLGPDRFRLINQVAREAVVRGGWAKEKVDDTGTKGRGKGKGKR
ncbi:hypothetical protein H2200_010790 [Cladophialophora chaetospira]|uniref:RWD domain-containing protein n=1 Tax=Cladophialophora chaetospira TaxID=386627 RepID=A0AA38X0S5_9EURO|nr:hypothetical protein H2200_010790 [Cladophialophora chaetospira]